MKRGVLVMVLLGLAGCSFTIAATEGSKAVHRRHAWIDAGLGFIPTMGCALAAIAWGSPDQYAPVQGDPSSWDNPSDRTNTRDIGATWTPIACTVAAVFLASTIYGQVVAPEDRSSDAQVLAPAAAFANWFQAAGQTQSPNKNQTPQPQSCMNDFACGTGFMCVKRKYTSSGYCAKAVDSTGVQTFDGPSLDSVGPNMGDRDCQVDGCPAGFRCDAPRGVCLK